MNYFHCFKNKENFTILFVDITLCYDELTLLCTQKIHHTKSV